MAVVDHELAESRAQARRVLEGQDVEPGLLLGALAVVQLEVLERLEAFGSVLEQLQPLVDRYTNNPAARFMANRRSKE